MNDHTGRDLDLVLDERVMVRAPLLPVEAYPGDDPDAWSDPAWAALAGRAIAAASPTLARRPATDEAARAARLRFRIRMATRPTPFGLLAGVALARWAEQTDLRIAASLGRTLTEPPFEWLVARIRAAEDDPAVLGRLRLSANSALDRHGARFVLPTGVGPRSTGKGTAVSVKATRLVRSVLGLAAAPIVCDELVERAAIGGAPPAEVRALVGSLLRLGMLVSELLPSMTTPTPLERAHDLLAARVPGCAHARVLRRAREAAASLDAGRHVSGAELPQRWRSDAAMTLQGEGIGPEVAAEALRAAELLLGLSTQPAGRESLARYRQAFEHRYGLGRLVSVLEVLDPDRGLGYPAGYPGTLQAAAATSPAQPLRNEAFLRMATDALARGADEVELTAELLAELRGSATRLVAPDGIELVLGLAAASAEEVDCGRFLLVLGPNVGAMEAGRSLGRFSALLPGAPLPPMTEGVAADGALHAELVYLPADTRLGNVAVRRHPYAWEVPVGCAGGRGEAHAIPVNELHLRADSSRLVLYWPSRGADLRLHASHMLNPIYAPPLCRFLSEFAGSPEATQLTGFNWQAASLLPFLPRVRSGRVVLATATWQPEARDLPAASAEAFLSGLRRWQARWRMPDRVYLARGDQRLLLDLGEPGHRELLRRAVTATAPGRVVLQEALPGPEHAWARGPGGRYLTEIVATFRRRAPPAPRAPNPPAPRVTRAQRLCPPGSEWLQANLYVAGENMNALLAGPIGDLAGAATHAPSREMFFVRYADPATHLRLRWRLDAERPFAAALAGLAPWANALAEAGLIERWSIETYEREIERYGGMQTIEAAETLFSADSACAIAVLRACDAGPPSPLAACALSVDRLLADLGWAPARRHRLFEMMAGPERAGGALFREHGRELRAALGETANGRPASAAAWTIVRAALSARGALLSRLSAAKAHWDVPLDGSTAPAPVVAASLCHMTVNRLLGQHGPEEQALHDLLRRVHHSLIAHPAGRTRRTAPAESVLTEADVAGAP